MKNKRGYHKICTTPFPVRQKFSNKNSPSWTTEPIEFQTRLGLNTLIEHSFILIKHTTMPNTPCSTVLISVLIIRCSNNLGSVN